MHLSGKLQADAAAAEGVEVFLFSILEDVEKRSKVRILRLSSHAYSACSPAVPVTWRHETARDVRSGALCCTPERNPSDVCRGKPR